MRRRLRSARGLDPALADPHHDRDREIQRGADPYGEGETEGTDQHVAGHEAAEHGAGGVERVEGRDVPAECGGALDQISTQYLKGRAHQGRGHAEQPEGEEKSHEAEEPERGRQRLMQPDVERRQSLERYGKEKGAEPDPGLEARVDRQHTAPAIDESPDPETAQREPGHERSEDRADGQDRIAEQEVKHAGPRHFIEEAADTGEKAEDEHATTEDSARSGRDHRHGSIQVAASPDTSPSRGRPGHPPWSPGRPTIAEVEAGSRDGQCELLCGLHCQERGSSSAHRAVLIVAALVTPPHVHSPGVSEATKPCTVADLNGTYVLSALASARLQADPLPQRPRPSSKSSVSRVMASSTCPRSH